MSIPKMTRKHYEFIAEEIRFLQLSEADRLYVAKEFADSLRLTNHRFDRDRFLEACKVV